MGTLRSLFSLTAALALAACASTPPAPPVPGMSVTSAACDPSQNPYGCDEVPDYSDSYYGTGYPAYPVLLPYNPIVVPPPTPPVKPPPPTPPPKSHGRTPPAPPCPKGSKVCP